MHFTAISDIVATEALFSVHLPFHGDWNKKPCGKTSNFYRSHNPYTSFGISPSPEEWHLIDEVEHNFCFREGSSCLYTVAILQTRISMGHKYKMWE
jgi:hypothetical protein